jgi:aryl-alcohol dehydrogenase-like predicted oxidoreductase
VVGTKYTLRLNSSDTLNANLGGNSRKSMLRSVEGSLKRLNTDYIDLLYLHMWDFTTPVEEVLQSVTHLIQQGKVLYFAFSDTPAWVISYAVAKAESHGWARPVAVQIPYSLMDRAVERDVLPAARGLDLAVLPWGMLEGGALTGKYKDSTEQRRHDSANEAAIRAGEKVVALAAEIGRSPAQVAINWVRQQPGTMIPILGCRKVAQIEDNLRCLDFQLTDTQLESLNAVADFRPGFPLEFLRDSGVLDLVFGDTFARLDNHRDFLSK